jgi:hypothetical protein
MLWKFLYIILCMYVVYMAHNVQVKKMQTPAPGNLDRDIDFICRSFGYFSQRDKQDTAGKIFRLLVKETSGGSGGLRSDDIAVQFKESEAGFNKETSNDTKISGDPEKYMRRGALAGMYMRDKLDTRKMDREEIWKLIQSGKIKIPNVKEMEKGKAISHGIREYRSSIKKDMYNKREQWIQTVSINHAVLGEK